MTREHWTVRWEFKSWMKSLVASMPGYLGSSLRRRAYGFAGCGSDVFLGQGLWVESPGRMTIGNHVAINCGCRVHAGGSVTIGDWVLIGPGVTIYATNYSVEPMTQVPVAMRPRIERPVTIGRNAWLEPGCTIMPGVTVGQDAVVAAGSVVTRDVAPGTLVACSPAREVRKLAVDEP